MEIGVVGVNHNLTPIDIREKFNFSESKRIESSTILQDEIDEVLILSTCNRSEIFYANREEGLAVDIIKNFYKSYFACKDIDKYLFSKTNEEAIRHLYLVTGGLDSIVIGEDQIMCQVKEAMEFSMDLNFTDKFLNRAFQSSLNVGKKIRSNIGISTIPLSTSYIGIKMIRDEIVDFKGKSALVIGAGEISELAIKYLNESNLDNLYVTNRSDGRLKALFDRYPRLEKVSYQNRHEFIDEVDILISATAAVHTIVEDKDFADRKKPLYILDLGLPRDIDPKIASRDLVSLTSLDDLEEKSMENQIKRQELANKAELLIEEDVREYMDWLGATSVDPILSSLDERITSIEKDAVSYLNRRLDLSAREQRISEQVIRYVLNRITREVRLGMKINSDNEIYHEVMADLFDLEIK